MHGALPAPVFDDGFHEKDDAGRDRHDDEHDTGELHGVAQGAHHLHPRIVVLLVEAALADEERGVVRDLGVLLEESGEHRVVRDVVGAIHQRRDRCAALREPTADTVVKISLSRSRVSRASRVSGMNIPGDDCAGAAGGCGRWGAEGVAGRAG